MRHPIVFITALLLIVAVEVVVLINYDSVKDDLGAITDDSTIHVSYPKNGDLISSPLIVTGRARGNWFFEASFPVMLTDWDGRIIAEGTATAKGDWMTANFVSFEAILDFDKPSFGKNGLVILQMDNPSELSDSGETLEIPVNFE